MNTATQIITEKLISKRRSEAPVVGMVLFIIVEAMFFAALISAYLVTSAQLDPWPPKGMPILSFGTSSFNTIILLSSGIFVAMGYLQQNGTKKSSRKDLMLIGLLLGLCFLIFQGQEWIGMLEFGASYASNTHSSFFYVVIGSHGLHALGALIWLALVVYKKKTQSNHARNQELLSACLLWYFVVLVWPILYYLIYIYPGMVVL
ncbi:MAG: hypothetical protein HN548_03585 [Opitutae bacterium]|jgi:heme/copper-type cytochrome/quinol oxidase subunit 3|nr:hypothetical protein [Opitutae bacterium]